MTRPHYDIGDIQPIDYMKDQMSAEQYEGFLRGNVMKYISRYPHKGGIDDLEKAQWYLQRLVELKKGREIQGSVDFINNVYNELSGIKKEADDLPPGAFPLKPNTVYNFSSMGEGGTGGAGSNNKGTIHPFNDDN